MVKQIYPDLESFVGILSEISYEYVNSVMKAENRTPTYPEFAAHLLENYGVNDRNEIVDQEKWIKYILSRS